MNVILDIQPLRIDTSPTKQPTSVKPTSSGVWTFIGVKPKIFESAKSTAFKQPKLVKETTSKPSISDHVSYVMIIIMLYLVSLMCQLCWDYDIIIGQKHDIQEGKGQSSSTYEKKEW